MNSSLQLAEEYEASLAGYLAGAGEPALERAYEVGRNALSQGAGALDLSHLHRDALAKSLERAGASKACVEAARRACDFFMESLVPFEAIERGFREITVRLRRANEALEEKTRELEAVNKELEAFSYSVSHDLRAPLRAMDGFSQALMEDYTGKLDERGRDYLTRVRGAAQRMAELVDGLLNLSRLARTEIERTDVDLSAMALEISEELRRAEPDRKAEFAVASGLRASGDARLLHAVLVNLLGNAWKFTRKVARPRIEFGRAEKEGEAVYFVRDNGAGFDMAYADKLFGAFQRLHGAKEFEGTGIGLATVQRIVHRHGGRVWAEGVVDRGATFYFTLPEVKGGRS